MIAVVFSTAEVRAALAGTLTEIRRPVAEARDCVPAAFRALFGSAGTEADAVFPDGSGKGWIAWWGDGPFSAEDTARAYPGNEGFPCPLGDPGGLLFVKERWGAGCRPCPFNGWADGLEYEADDVDAVAPDDPLPLYEVPGHDLCEWEGQGWQPAEDMPLWASRLAFRSRGARVEREGDVWMWVAAVERVNRPDGSPMPPREIGGTS